MLMIQREGGESEIGLLPKELRSAFAAIEIGLIVDVDNPNLSSIKLCTFSS